jgi:HAD superfamily hydrolase (TIGR01549 family)
MPENRVVIFDLDNTLVINRPAAKTAYETALRYIAKESKEPFEKLYNHWKRLVQSLQTETEPEKRAFEYSLRQLFNQHRIADTLIMPAIKVYEKELVENLKPMPGAKEVVSWLKEQQCFVAVAAGTDRTMAKKKLKKTQLLPFIDLIVSASETAVMKPSKAYFELVLTETECTPQQTLVVSDSKKEDIDIAKTMGLQTIEVPINNTQLTAIKPQLAEFLTFAK